MTIEFQAVAHDGILEIPLEHQRKVDGRQVHVVLVVAETEERKEAESLFTRLRRVHIQGPPDLSTNHDSYVIGDHND